MTSEVLGSPTTHLLEGHTDPGSSPVTPKIVKGVSNWSVASQLSHGDPLSPTPSGSRSLSRRRRKSSVPALIVNAADKASFHAFEAASAASSPGDVTNAMNQTLILFITHFFVLYVAQVVMQVSVMIVDYANERNYISFGIHALDFLTATDFFIVFLFVIEVAVQQLNQGVDAWLKSWWHRFDLLVLIVSVLFVTVDIAQVSVFPCHVSDDALTSAPNESFELFRDLLRLVRIAVFLQELKQLLQNPLEHFSMLAEDLAPQAGEINEYI